MRKPTKQFLFFLFNIFICKVRLLMHVNTMHWKLVENKHFAHTMSFCSGINAILFAPIQFDSKFCFIFCPLSQDSYLFILYLLSSLVSSPREKLGSGRMGFTRCWRHVCGGDFFLFVSSSFFLWNPILIKIQTKMKLEEVVPFRPNFPWWQVSEQNR